MKSLTGKFTVVIAVVVVVAFAAVVVLLSMMLTRREDSLLRQHGHAQSQLLIKALTFSMNEGVVDVTPLEDALRDFQEILEFRLEPLDVMTGTEQAPPDEVERRIFSTSQAMEAYQSLGEHQRVFRISEPIVAQESCLNCHAGIQPGQTVAVTSMFLSHEDAEAALRRFVTLAVALAAGAGLAVLVMVWAAVRLIVIRPIRRLRALMIDIAQGEGDLTRRVKVRSRDEIGEVAQWINTFIEQIHGIVRNIKGYSAANAQLTQSLSAAVEQTRQAAVAVKENTEAMRAQLGHLNEQNNTSSASVAEILASVTSLAGRIESQASAVAQASAAIEEMSASIDSVARIADQKLAAADELQDITRSGGQKVSEVNTLITDISRSVDDISEMISLINSVAAQTNLLSMNASIEAAHAGEFGKGFAVVAEEIRRLAESTATNSKRITATLKEIITKIQGSLEASTDSSAAFTRLDEEVKEVVGAFTEIAGSTQELAHGGREILQASGSLLQITEEIRGGSAEMKQGAEDINRALVEITHISGESKQAVDDVAQRTAEISSAIDQVASLSEEDRDVGVKLTQEVRRFRVEGEGGAAG